MQNTNIKNRIDWVDTLRFFAIFAIVIGHSIVGTTQFKIFLYSFHVPAFFFVSGFLMYKSSQEKFLPFLKKKFCSLMIPYYFFSLASIAIFAVMGRFAADKLGIAAGELSLSNNLYGMLYANPQNGYMKWNLPLWFIPAFFITVIVAYFIIKLINLIKNTSVRLPALLTVTLVILSFDVCNYYCFKIDGTPFNLETVLYMLPFFLFGCILKLLNFNPEKFKTGKPVTMISGVVLIAAGAFISYLNGNVDYVSLEFENIYVFYITATIIITGFVFLCSGINSRVTSYVGKNTISILLMHKFPILAMQVVLSGYMAKSVYINDVAGIIIAAVSIAASLLVGYFIEKYLPFIYGHFGHSGRGKTKEK